MMLLGFLIVMNFIAVYLRQNSKKMELNNSKINKSKKLKCLLRKKTSFIDINLDINQKEVTALIGPSGCGKSTFIRCINRMNDVIDICKVEGLLK